MLTVVPSKEWASVGSTRFTVATALRDQHETTKNCGDKTDFDCLVKIHGARQIGGIRRACGELEYPTALNLFSPAHSQRATEGRPQFLRHTGLRSFVARNRHVLPKFTDRTRRSISAKYFGRYGQAKLARRPQA